MVAVRITVRDRPKNRWGNTHLFLLYIIFIDLAYFNVNKIMSSRFIYLFIIFGRNKINLVHYCKRSIGEKKWKFSGELLRHNIYSGVQNITYFYKPKIRDTRTEFNALQFFAFPYFLVLIAFCNVLDQKRAIILTILQQKLS